MPNYNLTTQQIKDTYQQLVQVSGSAIVNGTGSLVNAFDYPSNSSYNTFSSSVAVKLNTIIAGSGSADWNLITNIPVGLVSGSSQVNLSLAFGTASKAISSSYATNASTADFTVLANVANESTLVNVLSTTTNASFPVTFVSSDSNQQVRIDASAGDFFYNPSTNRLSVSNLTVANTIVGNIQTASFALTTTSASRATSAASADTATLATTATSATSASFATNANNLDGLDSTAFAQLSLNNNFSGTQNFLNIAVSGTASIAYVQQVTGSAVIIGEEFIILNTSVPAARYAGIKVYDTGSTESTASFLFDGLYNDWFYQYSGSDGTDFGVALFGPEYSAIGTPSYPTANRIQKGTGGHHLVDSNITDDGTLVSVSTPLSTTQITSSGGMIVESTNGTLGFRAQATLLSNPAFSRLLPTSLTFSGSSATQSTVNSLAGELALSVPSGRRVFLQTAGSPRLIALDQEVYTQDAVFRATLSAQVTGSLDVTAGVTASGGFFGNLTGNATTATTATSASRAISAASADTATLATTATSASRAISAASADTATTATTATSASYALTSSIAIFATTAGSATTATSASFATTSSFAAGNFQVDGQMFSPVFSGSIASSTSSIDFNEGNFAVLTLTSATHIGNPSNIKSGTTYTLIMNSGSLAATYGTSFKFAGGTKPTLSNGVDIVTMVSDGSRLFATGLANFS